MGLANLVPGVSGGTMVLVFGIYDDFIGAVSDLTRFRISLRPVLVLAMLFGISFVTIVTFSSAMQFLMERFQPGMLALFIGMTLGGAPLLYRDVKPLGASGTIATVLGIIVMALVAFVLKPDTTNPNFLLYFLGGIIGSSAMILPGISGSYLLLVLGLYLPIIGGISDMKDALRAGNWNLLFSVGTQMALPVGLGVVVGIASLSNVLKFCMEKYHKPTLGFLLGLLLGSVLGLYPFQQLKMDKLPRHAVALEGGNRELRVMGFGWSVEQGDPTYSNLMRLENSLVSVRVLGADPANAPGMADVQTARAADAVIVAHDLSVPREVRRAAARKGDDEVELMILPNAEFSWPKAGLVVILIGVGYLATFLLSRIDGESSPPGPAKPLVAEA